MTKITEDEKNDLKEFKSIKINTYLYNKLTNLEIIRDDGSFCKWYSEKILNLYHFYNKNSWK